MINERPDSSFFLSRLLQEVDNYLAAFSGPGIADVRAGITEYSGGQHRTMTSRANTVVTAWLPRCLHLVSIDFPKLADRLSTALPSLAWITYDGYDQAKIGSDFASNHAYASIIGEDAPLFAPDFDLGLFLIAPHVLYRDHCHAAPELYAPLTGPHGWRFQPDVPLVTKPKHEPVWNEPGQPHLTKVGPEPFLSLYCWTRDNDKPATVVPATDWAELETLRLRLTTKL